MPAVMLQTRYCWLLKINPCALLPAGISTPLTLFHSSGLGAGPGEECPSYVIAASRDGHTSHAGGETTLEPCNGNAKSQLKAVIEHLVGRQGQPRGAQVHVMHLSDQKGWSQDPPLPRPHLRVGREGKSILLGALHS